MTKTVSLTISERLFSLSILNAYKGGLELLKRILDDVNQFSIVEEDWTRADRKISPPDKDGNSQWNWSDEKGGLKEVVIHEDVAKYLKEKIDEKDKAGELGITDKAAISLREKLV